MGQGKTKVKNKVFKGRKGWLYALLIDLGWGSNPGWLLDYPMFKSSPYPQK